MPESTINAIITAIGSLLGGIIGAYATIRAAKVRPPQNPNDKELRFPLVGIIAGTVFGAVATLLILALLGLFPTNQPSPTRITIPANTGWVGTGLILSSGQLLLIQSEGVVDYNGQDPNAGNSNPDGDGSPCDKAAVEIELGLVFEIDCLFNGASYGALVGRVGESSPFMIGSNRQFTIGTSGELFLGVNDCCSLSDNSGEFRVTISSP